MKYDLHVHTTLSDGSEDKLAVLKQANEIGILFISFTDHNIIDYRSNITINNLYEELYKTTQNVNIIEGIEFDVYDYPNMHILGYNIHNKDLIIEKMKELVIENDIICQKILYNIAKYYNIFYTREEILTEMKCDYLNKRLIIDWMINQGHAKNYVESGNLFTNKNSPTYEKKVSLCSKEILDLISKSGGISVLAHPSTLKMSNYQLEETIIKLKAQGLQGIEVLNTSKTTIEQQEFYQNLANKYNLLTTSGTDFHNYENYTNGIGVDNEISNNLLIKVKVKK